MGPMRPSIGEVDSGMSGPRALRSPRRANWSSTIRPVLCSQLDSGFSPRRLRTWRTSPGVSSSSFSEAPDLGGVGVANERPPERRAGEGGLDAGPQRIDRAAVLGFALVDLVHEPFQRVAQMPFAQ